MFDRARRAHQILKIEAPQAPEARRFICELASRQIRLLPQRPQRTSRSPVNPTFKLKSRFGRVRQLIEQIATEMLNRAQRRSNASRRRNLTAWHRLRFVTNEFHHDVISWNIKSRNIKRAFARLNDLLLNET